MTSTSQPDFAIKRVAFQGEPGAFSEAAAHRLLGDEVETIPCATFEGMFDAVESGAVPACLAPVENSLAGSVHANYDLMMLHNFHVIGEVELRIRHCLIARPGIELADLKAVMSHPVALAQCRRFLQMRPHIKKIVAEDTAGSVREIMAKGLNDHAAIAGRHAAKVYGATVLAEGIEDHPENFTRFLLLSPIACVSADADKTSVVFSLSNQPGSLFRALATLALRDIDLVKIESRPIEGQVWEYRFYIDFLGSTGETRVQNALNHLRELSPDLRVLGCYKRAERP